MAQQKEQIDQDALAAEWGVALEAEQQAAEAEKAAAPAEPENGAEAMAAQWAAMVDDGHLVPNTKGGAERILTQEEIDSLLGFSLDDISLNDNSGIRAIINSAMVSYERLPMLEIVFDRLVRLMTTSLRNFTSDNVEVSLDRITSVRFGDYLNSIPLPAILGVFKAEEWENSGLVTVNSSLIYSIIDVLLGGRRGQTAIRIEGRPYTTIETNLVKRMIEVVLADAELAFKPLSPVKFNIDRLETNPRFAAISRPANAAILVRLRIDMEDRGGNIELLLPYATIEPIREVLLQMFMGEKFGRDPTWEGHLATEIGQAEIAVDAVLYEARLPLKRMMQLERRRHADARTQVGRAGDRALRRRDAHRGTHGPRRRPRRGARRQTVAQTEHDLRHVRNGGRLRQPDGGTMSDGLGLIIESLVAILLMFTIGYCMLLNRRLKLLRADEDALRATIARADHGDRDCRARHRRTENRRARLRDRIGRAPHPRRTCHRRSRSQAPRLQAGGRASVADRARRPAQRGSNPAGAGCAGDRGGRASLRREAAQ